MKVWMLIKPAVCEDSAEFIGLFESYDLAFDAMLEICNVLLRDKERILNWIYWNLVPGLPHINREKFPIPEKLLDDISTIEKVTEIIDMGHGDHSYTVKLIPHPDLSDWLEDLYEKNMSEFKAHISRQFVVLDEWDDKEDFEIREYEIIIADDKENWTKKISREYFHGRLSRLLEEKKKNETG